MIRKLIADVDVGAYNVIFVMPKLRELLTRENDRDQLIVTDTSGSEQEIKRLRLLVAERERSLTDPHVIINVMRSLDEFYEGMSALRGGDNTGLSVGSIDRAAPKLRLFRLRRDHGRNIGAADRGLGPHQIFGGG